jgi:hypothetical protein
MFMGFGMINDNLEPCPCKIQTSIDALEKGSWVYLDQHFGII